MRSCQFRDLGRIRYAEALVVQHNLAERRKRDEIPDQLIFVEHPHVITLGRNASVDNILATPEVLSRAGIDVHSTDRGGDVTYHGPGQIVGYPILDLKQWKRDVVAYVRAIEEVTIGAIAEFGVKGERVQGASGVWVGGAKVAAIGVHLSRWITSHGFALNVDTDLNYFRYIVPCGLTKPVTSLRKLGVAAQRDQVADSLIKHFERIFECRMETPAAHPAKQPA